MNNIGMEKAKRRPVRHSDKAMNRDGSKHKGKRGNNLFKNAELVAIFCLGIAMVQTKARADTLVWCRDWDAELDINERWWTERMEMIMPSVSFHLNQNGYTRHDMWHAVWRAYWVEKGDERILQRHPMTRVCLQRLWQRANDLVANGTRCELDDLYATTPTI